MKIKFTSASKWLQTMVIMSFLSLLFSSQLSAQNHHHQGQGGHGWNDSIPIWNDSLFHNFIDSLLITWIDSGFTFHDSGHFGNDSGHVFHNSGHTWHDSGHVDIDSGHTWHDSGHTFHDSGHTWNDSGFTFHDSGHLWNDSGFGGNDTGHCGGGGHGHRLENPNGNSQGAVNISIYPNPVLESAVMHIANTSGNVTFIMYDGSGRLAMVKALTNGDFQLDRANLGAGIYYYQITDGNTSISKGKLIFQ